MIEFGVFTMQMYTLVLQVYKHVDHRVHGVNIHPLAFLAAAIDKR